MKKHSESVTKLFDAILLLKSHEECARFFDDLCTYKELLSIAQRFEVARLLTDGKKFNEIVDMTGASTATIARVNRSLMFGAGGYPVILDRLNPDHESKIDPEAVVETEDEPENL